MTGGNRQAGQTKCHPSVMQLFCPPVFGNLAAATEHSAEQHSDWVFSHFLLCHSPVKELSQTVAAFINSTYRQTLKDKLYHPTLNKAPLVILATLTWRQDSVSGHSVNTKARLYLYIGPVPLEQQVFSVKLLGWFQG